MVTMNQIEKMGLEIIKEETISERNSGNYYYPKMKIIVEGLLFKNNPNFNKFKILELYEDFGASIDAKMEIIVTDKIYMGNMEGM